VAAKTIAGRDAKFQVDLTGLSVGNYLFSVYSDDNEGKRSSLFTFPITVMAGVTINVSGIFISPTLEVDKREVKQGDNISIFGRSVPNSQVTINVNSENDFFRRIAADEDGFYLYNFDTSLLENGWHYTKSKSAIDTKLVSNFSNLVSFTVGKRNVLKEGRVVTRSDLNGDGRVNLVDFSIMAFWYKRPLSSDFTEREKEYFNGDGVIDLIDFSIMAYYWTG